MRSILFFSISIFVFSSNVFSSDDLCSRRRLDRKDEPYFFLKPSSQYRMGTCYAHATAQMVNGWRALQAKSREDISELLMTPSSPLMVALQSKLTSDKEDPLSSGSFCYSYNQLKKYGSCNDLVIPDVFKKRRAKEVLHQLREFYNGFQNDLSLEWAKKVHSYLKYDLPLTEKDIPSVGQIQEYIERPYIGQFLKFIMGYRCYSEHQMQYLDLPDCLSVHDRSRNYAKTFEDKTLSMLDEEDSAGVAVMLCSQVLRKGHSVSTMVKKGKPSKVCKNHVVLAIGKRRSSEGKCQVLVRNSWGERCSFYSKEWDCEDGDIWLDADVLFENTFGLSYLEGISGKNNE